MRVTAHWNSKRARKTEIRKLQIAILFDEEKKKKKKNNKRKTNK
jgi:hypothetical protein